MPTIFERVSSALATIAPAVPYAMAPYKSTGDLPAQYLAYELIDSLPDEHADNAETARSYVVQVTIWSAGGLVTIPDVDAAMVTAGFAKSSWRQLPQDPESGHYGLAKDFVYLESL
jgi:hypothetical protein